MSELFHSYDATNPLFQKNFINATKEGIEEQQRKNPYGFRFCCKISGCIVSVQYRNLQLNFKIKV